MGCAAVPLYKEPAGFSDSYRRHLTASPYVVPPAFWIGQADAAMTPATSSGP